jgi:hypothetical protein
MDIHIQGARQSAGLQRLDQRGHVRYVGERQQFHEQAAVEGNDLARGVAAFFAQVRNGWGLVIHKRFKNTLGRLHSQK